ncbi:MAG: alanine--tRNA ligase [candidate division Zixibacteria bacterium]|nr:alanine--tRNA ligase [candidate division Zixibacteria bacterium]
MDAEKLSKLEFFMKSADIREGFLKYFGAAGHTRVPSSSLIPQDDPSLLFTNAGMNQFKKVFLGLEVRPYKRAVSSQKCMRAGGKHNDLENVGLTPRHHTFFEMLGNFSFGDYFKKEAVTFAWEYLTKQLNLPAGRLWPTVFTEDDEAEKHWLAVAPETKSRLRRFGEADNFWSMGETGPCGPCSEIHYDRGEKYGCGKPDCGPNCECGRFMELWNLVFMQYNRDESGKMTPLPKPSVDTGAGLERLASVLQGVESNYDTDLFVPIIRQIESLTGKKYSTGPDGVSFRVIADHLRALSFCFADGALPSNEGRGYVLRRILRRAARHAHLLGKKEPFIYRLVDTLAAEMGGVYPELKAKKEHIKLVIEEEEKNFGVTLENGLELAAKEFPSLAKKGQKIVPGELVFKFYDTYGFPADLTELVARDYGLTVDWDGFEKELEKQRERSRKASKFVSAEATIPIEFLSTIQKDVQLHFEVVKQLQEKHAPSSKFIGYDHRESKGKVLDIAKDEIGRPIVIFNVTPFYAEAGGQVGDTGKVIKNNEELKVVDTQKKQDYILLYLGSFPEYLKELKGEELSEEIDWKRRQEIMRNHTTTHLVHKALRNVLGEHVHQAGSLVAPDRLRFDFTHFKPLSAEELKRIEEEVNEKILESILIETLWDVPLEEAKKMGAMMLFGEKYGDRVRVIKIADYSLELCGGTHVASTGQIGLFSILSESGIASGVRRIEAVTGSGFLHLAKGERQLLFSLAEKMKVPVEILAHKVEELLSSQKQLEKRLEELKKEQSKEKLMLALQNAAQINGIKVVATELNVENRQALMDSADLIVNAKEKIAGVLAAVLDSDVTLVAAISRPALESIKAPDLVKEVAVRLGGTGGGRPHLAQGGGKNKEKLAEVLTDVPKMVEKLLSR